MEAPALRPQCTLLFTALHANCAQHDRQLAWGGGGLRLLTLNRCRLLCRNVMLSN